MASKPAVSWSVYTAARRRTFVAPTSVVADLTTMSETSKSCSGSGRLLFSARVLSSPGTRSVRTISESAVFGLAMTTALVPSSTRRMRAKQSALEQRAKVSASVKPHIASSSRSSSENLLMGSWRPTVEQVGNVRGTLLNPYAMATSSTMSHACRMSARVGGTHVLIVFPSAASSPRSIILVRRRTTAAASRLSPTTRLTSATEVVNSSSSICG
eukprot:Amastigsp_a339439_708.p3 type:complete len:214 gc:universal Amastigsp_a339439_708:281-922(+)